MNQNTSTADTWHKQNTNTSETQVCVPNSEIQNTEAKSASHREPAMNQNTGTVKYMAYAKHKYIPNTKHKPHIQTHTGGGEPVTESLLATAMNQNTGTTKHQKHKQNTKQIPENEIQKQKHCFTMIQRKGGAKSHPHLCMSEKPTKARQTTKQCQRKSERKR